jgi:hypothetical protein
MVNRCSAMQVGGGNSIVRNFVICTRIQVLLGVQIKEFGMGGTCEMYGIENKYTHCFGEKT